MSNRVIAITGASAGVGRAVALAFAHKGDLVGLIARSETGLNDAKLEIEREGGLAATFPADVADAAAMRRAADGIEQTLGPIDVWVNSAMVTVFSRVDDITPEEYRRVTEVTYLGYVHGTLEALWRMKRRARGTIIQVGSALAYRSIPLQSAYCGAKAAIRGFTESLRCELLHDNSPIQLCAVHLPAVNTPQFSWARAHLQHHPQPVPPIFQPEVAADAIVYAADHPERREYWIGSASVKAILGNRVAPGLLDRMMAQQAWSGQFTDERISPTRPDNLFTPVDGLHGTHGIFDDRSASFSLQAALARHKWAIAGSAAGVGAAFVAGFLGAVRTRR
jgi:NAD(P)-dependent dehydrogenase (short-subunit alcohol dehydrogenase family)